MRKIVRKSFLFVLSFVCPQQPCFLVNPVLVEGHIKAISPRPSVVAAELDCRVSVSTREQKTTLHQHQICRHTIPCALNAVPIQQWPVEKLGSFHEVPGETFNTTPVVTPVHSATVSSSVHIPLPLWRWHYAFIKKLTYFGVCSGRSPWDT
ncbi:hypothetical protein CBL_02528 [Carabus blaptoides fortunei]